MGAPVNLAARLMSSKVNKGILVDEEVRMQADSRYAFNSLPPVTAKGYDKPVAILEPIENIGGNRKKKSTVAFVGRTVEKVTILNVASDMLADSYDQQSTMLFLLGESGMGKTYLTRVAVEEMKKMNSLNSEASKIILSARSSSTETKQRIPLRCVTCSNRILLKLMNHGIVFSHRFAFQFFQADIPEDCSRLLRCRRVGFRQSKQSLFLYRIVW